MPTFGGVDWIVRAVDRYELKLERAGLEYERLLNELCELNELCDEKGMMASDELFGHNNETSDA